MKPLLLLVVITLGACANLCLHTSPGVTIFSETPGYANQIPVEGIAVLHWN